MSKYKRYERYKDSGIEWIGEIPEHWGIIKLKFLSTIFKGKNLKELTDEWREEILPYLSMEYLRNSGDTLTLYAYPEKNLVTVNNGDILILWDGSNAGEILEGKNGILSSTMAKIVPNNIVTRYLYWFLKGIEKFFKGNTVGMGIPHVNGEILKNHLVLLPNLEEQNSIANFLDQKTAEIDSLIADKKKLIELLQEKRQAIITEAVTKGLNPNVKMKDSGIEWIGEIPEHWEIKPLKRIFKIVNGGTPSSSEESYWNGDITWITPNDLSNLTEIYIKDSERKITKDGLHNCSAKIVPKGSIVISTRAPIGYVAIAGVDLCTNQGCKSLVAINKVNPKYFYYWISSISFYLNVLGQGTTFMELSNNNLSMVELLIPLLSEQEKIASFLDQKTAEIDDLIFDINTQIQKLKEYRQSLISEAVTGKIDVRDYVVSN